MKCIIYGSKYEAILKMLLLYLVEYTTYHSFFFMGTGADFYQQLKLDFSRHFSKSI